jgi:hypothetical protein
MPLLVDCKSPMVSTAQRLSMSVLAWKYGYDFKCQIKNKILEIYFKTNDYLPSTDLVPFHGILFGFFLKGSLQFSKFFRLDITEET